MHSVLTRTRMRSAWSARKERRDDYWEAFEACLEPDGECLLFVSGQNQGYAMFRGKLVHRIAWERVNGPLDSKIPLHHTCHQLRCVRISHLQPQPSWQAHSRLRRINS